MSKAPLKDIQENIAHMRPCPNCTRTPGLADRPDNQMGQGPNGKHPRGRFKGYYRSAMPACDFCQGLGYIFLNRICECGYPAVKWDEKDNVWTCGLQACTKSALWRKNRGQAMTPAQSKDWYGHGGGMFGG
jgi:hypothetical protein